MLIFDCGDSVNIFLTGGTGVRRFNALLWLFLPRLRNNGFRVFSDKAGILKRGSGYKVGIFIVGCLLCRGKVVLGGSKLLPWFPAIKLFVDMT